MGICCHSKAITEPQSPAVAFTKNERSASESSDTRWAIALYSLEAKDEAILRFSKGDKLIIEDDSDPDWFLVRHKKTHKRGFAPKTYLILDTIAGEEEWFFGEVVRADAERLLLQPENASGTFMVRNSRIPGAYALSIKDITADTNEIVVRHYKIKTLDRGGYFISKESTFDTLQQLIAHYKVSANGLCRKLEKACLRPRPVITGPLPDNRDEYEIPFNSLTFIRQLGKGNFGEVFFGHWNGTLEVAIKRLINNGVQSNDFKNDFKREISVMKAISHPNIVRLFAVCTEKEPYCIVMEYLCNGNLQQYLKTHQGKQLRLPSLVNMAAQISNGMKYLETEKLIHRDLAARNILVGEASIVKLADFGLARIMDEEVYVTSGGKLPVKWTAPEAYVSGEFTIKADVWSFGIVLFEIFTHGESPYRDMKNFQVVEALKKNYRMPKPSDPECSDAVYEIMLQCWKKEPDERPTFEFLYHYFTDYYVTSEKSYREA
uniref:Tyrosine-protein kinase n=1 Tax=Parasteatoda tepidariorum TaxID=114398 RepID=A0A2L2XWC2_PARTP